MVTHPAGQTTNQSELMGSEVAPCQRGEKGMIALLNTTLPHGWREGIKKMDEKMDIPRPGGSAAPVQPASLGVTPTRLDSYF